MVFLSDVSRMMDRLADARTDVLGFYDREHAEALAEMISDVRDGLAEVLDSDLPVEELPGLMESARALLSEAEGCKEAM